MSDHNNSNTVIRKKARSSSYPGQTLEKSINSVKTIMDNLGTEPFDRASAATALGYSGMSGAAAQAVAALVHYGLLIRTADTYRVSPLTEDIHAFRKESDRQSAIVKAAKQPKLFADLLNKYGGKSLPAMLDNILVRDHGINARVSTEVRKIFVNTMTFAGLLENGVLKTSDYEPGITAMPQPEKNFQAKSPTNPTGGSFGGEPGKANTIPISAGFSIEYPQNVPLFELMVNQEFVGAMTALKTAIDALPTIRGTKKAVSE